MYGNMFNGYPFIVPQMGQSNTFLPQINRPTQPQNDGSIVLYAPTAVVQQLVENMSKPARAKKEAGE